MEFCFVGYALDVIGSKWKLLILCSIYQNGVIRFNELQRNIDGISSLMLSKNLKELEAHGLVLRHQYNEIPPRVEYELTELGQELKVVIQSLDKWGCKVYNHKKSSF